MRVCSRIAALLALLFAASSATGCAATTPEPDPDPGLVPEEPPPTATATPTALVVESEVGALDRGAIQDAFAAATPKLLECVRQGRAKRQPLIGGAIEPVLRLDTHGRVLWSYLRDSTLGDAATERCILETLGALEWPKPSGGKEGETSQQLELGEPDERSPVAWSEADLGPKFAAYRNRIRDCRRRADTGPIAVTMYVDPTADGRAGTVVSAGAAVSDEKGAAAAECAVRAVARARVPSPGSYTAKVTIRVE